MTVNAEFGLRAALTPKAVNCDFGQVLNYTNT